MDHEPLTFASMMKMVRLCSYLLIAIFCVNMHAVSYPLPMRDAETALGSRVLKIALPATMVADHAGWPLPPIVDIHRIRTGDRDFYSMLYTTHDVKGPFWVGDYATFKFHIFIVKRPPDEQRDLREIALLHESLAKSYKSKQPSPKEGFRMAYEEIGGANAVVRFYDTFGPGGSKEPERREIFSIPLEHDLFLDLGFTVQCWASGMGKERRWKPEIEQYIQSIKASIQIFETRASKSGNQ